MLSRNDLNNNNTGNDIPTQFLCQITHEIMRDPVTASDGRNYERTEIINWFLTHEDPPMLGAGMDSNKILQPNKELQTEIKNYLKKNKTNPICMLAYIDYLEASENEL